MKAYVVSKNEDISPGGLNPRRVYVSSPVEGVILADSPEEAADLLGGEFRGQDELGGWIVFIPEAAFVPHDPDRDIYHPLYGVSWYQKGDISISHRHRGGLRLRLASVPLLQRTARVEAS